MKKKLFSLLLTMTLIVSTFASMGTLAYAGDGPVTVTTAAEMKTELEAGVNRDVVLGADITLDENVYIPEGLSSMGLDLNGHILTANKSIFLTKSYAGLTVKGNGTIIANNGTLFVVGSVNQDYNSTLEITAGTFVTSNADPLIMVTGTKEGAKAGKGLIILGGKFLSREAGDIIKVDDESYDNQIAISGGDLQSNDASCIASTFGANVLISGGSFYSANKNAIQITDTSNAFIDSGRASYVDGEEYTKSTSTSKKAINITKLGNNKLVQVGSDSAFSDVFVKTYPCNSAYYGTSPADGSKALIGADFHIEAGWSDGYKFVGWATDDTYDRDNLLQTGEEYSVHVGDFDIYFYPIFAKTLDKREITLSEETFEYDGTDKKPTVTVAGLIENTDFTVTYPSDAKSAGEKTITITGINDCEGETTVKYRITSHEITKIVLGKVGYYNGQIQQPSIQVFSGDVDITDLTDEYEVNITDSKLPGTYPVEVIGKNNYTGGATDVYTIKVKPTTIKSLKAGKKSFTVIAGKQSATYVSGYQLRYSLKSGMGSAKKVTIGTKSTAVSKTVKNLKSKKTYYVQVRSIKKISGKAYYSDWSAKRSVKVK